MSWRKPSWIASRSVCRCSVMNPQRGPDPSAASRFGILMGVGTWIDADQRHVLAAVAPQSKSPFQCPVPHDPPPRRPLPDRRASAIRPRT